MATTSSDCAAYAGLERAQQAYYSRKADYMRMYEHTLYGWDGGVLLQNAEKNMYDALNKLRTATKHCLQVDQHADDCLSNFLRGGCDLETWVRNEIRLLNREKGLLCNEQQSRDELVCAWERALPAIDTASQIQINESVEEKKDSTQYPEMYVVVGDMRDVFEDTDFF